MLRYEFSDGTSNKFWAITLAGKSFTTTYGKIGSAGQQTVKQLATAAEATREHNKLVAEKLRKGYKLVAGAARKAVVAIPKPRVANKADRKRLDALIAIGRMLAPNAKRLAADVTHAFADPVAYVVANAKRMNDRAIDEPIPTLPWVVLVNALDDANAAHSFNEAGNLIILDPAGAGSTVELTRETFLGLWKFQNAVFQ